MKYKYLPWFLLVLYTAIGVTALTLLRPKHLKIPVYQAVFLTNGQAYFGQLSVKNSEFDELKDVHYIQQNQGSTVLIHMGQESYMPTDEIKIAKSQILFYEDMASSSPVTQAILKNQ